MNKICIVKSTGELLQSQNASTSGTMIKNAIDAGYDIADLEEKEVTDEVLEQLIQDIHDASLTYEDHRRAEYPSIEDVTVALAEKEEGDSTMWDEVTAKRQAVKIKYPKS